MDRKRNIARIAGLNSHVTLTSAALARATLTGNHILLNIARLTAGWASGYDVNDEGGPEEFCFDDPEPVATFIDLADGIWHISSSTSSEHLVTEQGATLINAYVPWRRKFLEVVEGYGPTDLLPIIEPKIVYCEIRGLAFRTVYADFDNGTTDVELFSYCNSDYKVDVSEIMGKTKSEVMELRKAKAAAARAAAKITIEVKGYAF